MAEYVLNTWYPIAWSRDITQSLAQRRIVEKDVVMYRNTQGKVVAQLDICPHRMLPLSHGKLKGDVIQCGYHGMEFDCSGKCVRIPGQDKIPAGAKVTTYPTHEHMGLVWIWMGDADKADPAKVYDLPQYHDPAWQAVEGDALRIECNYLNLCDNLCDPSHVSFVHLTTLGNAASEDVPVQSERTENGVLTWRWVLDAPAIPLFQKFGGFTTNVDRWHYYHYTAPSIAVIDFGTAKTGTGAPEGNRDDCIQIYACHFMTPVDENTVIDHWLHVKNFKADDDTNKAMSASFREAFSEDKVILEAIHKNEKAYPDFKPVLLNLDASAVRMRRLVDSMIDAEKAERQSVKAA
ncbi:aromatic ring-hydroxylating dioxygenase subunit alpha [Pusillimonas sp. NJUB218]|uniref:aromatic ring-hydroxylating dioxygenase subunit alpha n=1 Tax=Pusillimonas sp. NJUB218 TaxID=2023230 RepID=UPI000F4BC896|nr:aromatic ring-hydroxylating dioxygenase subunit alpha [Pusillimonas sp. NJUB218]ROT44047.1 vanillate O-demethylase oxygenase [Pusillimonas sp. NJUB218]